MWTGGAALADLADVPFAPAVATRLDELRLTATEELIERELALGRHLKVVPELTELTRKHPYRETFWRQLMLGLYRSGRQSDALATFREAARVLADDLGIDPGPALAAMHQAILTQDPALDGPAPRHDLPRLPGELIGRDAELDRLLELARTTRLVTLTGTGGVGKTRLALEVAHRLRAEFVPLADVHTAEAAAARITGSGGTLLVLDNRGADPRRRRLGARPARQHRADDAHHLAVGAAPPRRDGRRPDAAGQHLRGGTVHLRGPPRGRDGDAGQIIRHCHLPAAGRPAAGAGARRGPLPAADAGADAQQAGTRRPGRRSEGPAGQAADHGRDGPVERRAARSAGPRSVRRPCGVRRAVHRRGGRGGVQRRTPWVPSSTRAC